MSPHMEQHSLRLSKKERMTLIERSMRSFSDMFFQSEECKEQGHFIYVLKMDGAFSAPILLGVLHGNPFHGLEHAKDHIPEDVEGLIMITIGWSYPEDSPDPDPNDEEAIEQYSSGNAPGAKGVYGFHMLTFETAAMMTYIPEDEEYAFRQVGMDTVNDPKEGYELLRKMNEVLHECCTRIDPLPRLVVDRAGVMDDREPIEAVTRQACERIPKWGLPNCLYVAYKDGEEYGLHPYQFDADGDVKDWETLANWLFRVRGDLEADNTLANFGMVMVMEFKHKDMDSWGNLFSDEEKEIRGSVRLAMGMDRNGNYARSLLHRGETDTYTSMLEPGDLEDPAMMMPAMLSVMVTDSIKRVIASLDGQIAEKETVLEALNVINEAFIEINKEEGEVE